jgi:hypothetical protein
MKPHVCIKPGCGKSYEDEDEDAYYCFDCREDNKKIAAQLDAKMKSIPRSKPSSLLAEYNAQPKGPYGYPIIKSN